MDAEARLIDRCKSGEANAWDEFFDAHYAAAGRFVSQFSPSLMPEDIEEICQETFLAAIRAIRSFHGGSRAQTWIFRIAANKTRDYLQRQRAAKRGGGREPVSLQAATPDGVPAMDPPSPQPGPDDILIDNERAAQVGLALDQLEPPCREIIELRYFGDLSYEEISGALRLNPKTVSSRLSKCLDRLEAIAVKIFTEGKTAPFSV